MARKKRGKASSRSAMGRMDDEEAERRKDVPMFSFEGLRVHGKTLAMYIGGIIAALIVIGIVVGAITSAANFDVSLSQNFVQAKAGATVTFDVTVQNTAQLSAYAYETHVIGAPPGWTILQGEDIFGLKAGESHVVTVEVLAAGATPPNHDYPMEVMVVAKTPDGARALDTKEQTVTVKLLGNDLEVSLLSHGSTALFDSGADNATASFSSCSAPPALASIAYPAGGEITAGSVGYRLLGSNLSTTGWIAVDIGGDGSYELNQSLNVVDQRFELPPDALALWSAANPGSGNTTTLPLRFRSCTDAAGAWNVSLSAPLLTFLQPMAAGGAYTVDFSNADLPTGTASVSLKVTNRESRAVGAVVSTPTLPPGWSSTLPPAGTTLSLDANGGERNAEFTINVAKNASAGSQTAEVLVCLQGNSNDCRTESVPLTVGDTQYFEVKSYIDPAPVKTVYNTRSTDILLFVRNLGNQPVNITPDVELPNNEIPTSFWYANHTMQTGETLHLDVNQTRFLVLHISASAQASQAVSQVHPIFRNAAAPDTGTTQRLFFNLNIATYPAPAADGPVLLGGNLTVEYTISTPDGALLYKTNQAAMGSLVDAGSRPTVANYSKPASSSYAPYQFTMKNASEYNGAVHEGFEQFLLGGYRDESFVLWLDPSQTQLPSSNPMHDQVVVIEVHIISYTAP